ncbi:unnamed protein product [Protopolystoma xenopodis]|uniref:Uncharacterized protein n=1 Tax=Protopolystoma xenopodis TaxID=117903 RepID=A0A3S5BAN3_9PLAT|nr:unnamed protein product [Protopolystoma xenopodis]
MLGSRSSDQTLIRQQEEDRLTSLARSVRKEEGSNKSRGEPNPKPQLALTKVSKVYERK